MPLHRNPARRSQLLLGALNIIARVLRLGRRRAAAAAPMKGKKSRILVLELWNIGDVVLVMPFLARLRALFPGATITLVSRPFASELLAGTGLVDEFIAAELAWQDSGPAQLLHHAMTLSRVGADLRNRKFDIAFSSRLHVREHFLLAISGATRTVGFALGGGDGALTDPVPISDGARHKVDDWIELLAPFGGGPPVASTHLHIEDSERSWATRYLASRGFVGDDLLVGIHPGASDAGKRWPLERFEEVAAIATRLARAHVLAFAEPSGYGTELFSRPGIIGARVGLRELMALIEKCDVLVCNDSGPMHVAGALGVPTVAVFGPRVSRWFAPLGAGHEILTGLEMITASDVLAAVERVLERRQTPL